MMTYFFSNQKIVKKSGYFLTSFALTSIFNSLYLSQIHARPVASSSQLQLTNLSYQTIERGIGTQFAVNVEVYLGRITTIDFSKTNEKISYIGLGDASKVVFNTDTPINSNSAKTIFLRTIKQIVFDGATTNAVTNLVVKTIDDQQKERLYNFQILHRQTIPNSLGIQIIPGMGIEPIINISQGHHATLNDVESGLNLAINRGYTNADDPVVFAVKKFLTLVREEEKSVTEAAKLVNVDLTIIIELGKLANEARGI